MTQPEEIWYDDPNSTAVLRAATDEGSLMLEVGSSIPLSLPRDCSAEGCTFSVWLGGDNDPGHFHKGAVQIALYDLAEFTKTGLAKNADEATVEATPRALTETSRSFETIVDFDRDVGAEEPADRLYVDVSVDFAPASGPVQAATQFVRFDAQAGQDLKAAEKGEDDVYLRGEKPLVSVDDCCGSIEAVLSFPDEDLEPDRVSTTLRVDVSVFHLAGDAPVEFDVTISP